METIIALIIALFSIIGYIILSKKRRQNKSIEVKSTISYKEIFLTLFKEFVFVILICICFYFFTRSVFVTVSIGALFLSFIIGSTIQMMVFEYQNQRRRKS